MTMQAFFDMGGYAAFVWPSYGIAFAVLVLLLWRAIVRMRAAERAMLMFEQEQAVEGGRRRARVTAAPIPLTAAAAGGAGSGAPRARPQTPMPQGQEIAP